MPALCSLLERDPRRQGQGMEASQMDSGDYQGKDRGTGSSGQRGVIAGGEM